MKALRDAIPAAERVARSKAIAATVLALPRFKAAKRVALFANFGSEVDTAEIEKAQPVRTGPKVGRNDPCPCGSGKKYKQCCGKL